MLSRSNFQIGMLFYYPVSFILMHHSIEGFIKVFLKKEKIAYGNSHELAGLLAKGAKETRLQFFKTDILDNQSTLKFLNELSVHYAKNKYGETGFSIQSFSLIRAYDDLVYAFIRNLQILYPSESEQNYTFDVPEVLLPFFTKDLVTNLRIKVWPEDLVDGAPEQTRDQQA